MPDGKQSFSLEKECFQSGISVHFRAFVVRYGFRNNLYTIWTSLYSFTVESIHYPLIEKQTDGFRDLQRQGLAIQLITEKNQDTSHHSSIVDKRYLEPYF